MAYSWTFQYQAPILEVKAVGTEEHFKEAMNYAFAVHDAIIANSACGVMCDERELIYNLSLVDTFKLAQGAMDHYSGIKAIAIVASKAQLTEVKLYCTYLSVNGIKAHSFLQLEEARTWLLEQCKSN